MAEREPSTPRAHQHDPDEAERKEYHLADLKYTLALRANGGEQRRFEAVDLARIGHVKLDTHVFYDQAGTEYKHCYLTYDKGKRHIKFRIHAIITKRADNPAQTLLGAVIYAPSAPPEDCGLWLETDSED